MSAKKKDVIAAGAALNCCLDLLTSLTAAACAKVKAAAFMAEHDLDDVKLDAIIDMLQSIADERTGARIALNRNGGDIELLGNAGALQPLRLRPSEAAALTHALERCHIDAGTQERIARALAPIAKERDSHQLLAGDDLFGGYYPTIAEALAVGARSRMLYRASAESHPSTRLIDPMYIEIAGQAAYLVAWNVEKDERRSYRLDRIAGFEMTDESVMCHPAQRTTAAESIAAHGEVAQLHWKTKTLFERCTWAGINHTEAREAADGGIDAPVSYTSREWLFNHVIAGGGDIVITSPLDLRADLAAYVQARITSAQTSTR